MKRLALILLMVLVGIAMAGIGCHHPKPVTPPETQKPATVDTTPKAPETPPPAPEEKPKIEESQFQTVYFDFDKYDLRADSRQALDANANLLKQFPSAIIRIEGHCDERGTVEYNLSLGEKRARSCMEYLNGLGIDQGRMSIISYGKERPAVEGHDEAAWSKNRRAEFRVVSQ